MTISRRDVLLGSAGALGAASFSFPAPAIAQAETIRIGCLAAITGPASAPTQGFNRGVNFAVDAINGAGGVKGRKLRAEVVDIDVLTPEGTVGAIQSLNGKKVHAIASAFVLIPQPAMDAAAATKVPYLHGNTSLASLDLVKSNPAKYKNVFQIDGAET